MARNSHLCVDVPLRNYSLTQFISATVNNFSCNSNCSSPIISNFNFSSYTKIISNFSSYISNFSLCDSIARLHIIYLHFTFCNTAHLWLWLRQQGLAHYRYMIAVPWSQPSVVTSKAPPTRGSTGRTLGRSRRTVWPGRYLGCCGRVLGQTGSVMEVHHPVFYVSLGHMQNSTRSSVTLKLKLTLTDTGGAVLTLMLGYRPGGELPWQTKPDLGYSGSLQKVQGYMGRTGSQGQSRRRGSSC